MFKRKSSVSLMFGEFVPKVDPNFLDEEAEPVQPPHPKDLDKNTDDYDKAIEKFFKMCVKSIIQLFEIRVERTIVYYHSEVTPGPSTQDIQKDELDLELAARDVDGARAMKSV